MCSRGLAMVALATMKRGWRPYSRAHSRCSRRSTSAVWHPNTPLQARQLSIGILWSQRSAPLPYSVNAQLMPAMHRCANKSASGKVP